MPVKAPRQQKFVQSFTIDSPLVETWGQGSPTRKM